MSTFLRRAFFVLLTAFVLHTGLYAQFVTERWETIHVGQTGVLRTYNDTLFYEDFEGGNFDCWESLPGEGQYGFSVTDELTLRNGTHVAYPYQGNYAAYEMDASSGGLSFSQMISPNIHIADANNTVVSYYVHMQATQYTEYGWGTTIVTTVFDEAALGVALDQSGTFYQPFLWYVNCDGCEEEQLSLNEWTLVERNFGSLGYPAGNYNFDFLHVNEGAAGMGVDNILVYGPRQDTIPAAVSALPAGTYTLTETVLRKGCEPVTVTVHWTIIGDDEPMSGDDLPEHLPDNVTEIECSFYPEGDAWSIQNVWSSDRSIKPVSNLVAPLVGDLDGDGTPEIVCFGATDQSTTIPYRVKELLVFDGATHAIKKVIYLPAYASSFTATPYGLVREGGRGLIVVAHDDGKLRAYDITALDALVWTSTETFGNTASGDKYTTVSFADLDNDGHAEIIVRNKVFDAATGALLCTATGGTNTGSSLAHQGNSGAPLKKEIAMACTANIDPSDDLVEVILGNEIYKPVVTAGRISGLQLWRTAPSLPTGVNLADGHAQVADFNLDGNLDVFISNRYVSSSNYNNGKVCLYVWDVANNTVSNAMVITTGTVGKSLPLIANIDTDDSLEVVIQCAGGTTSGGPGKGMIAYRYNYQTKTFRHLWTIGVSEDSYSNGVTCFDFDQDGEMELLVCDQVKMQIVDGNGRVKSTLSYYETTIMQYPIIADVDNDGHAEIVSVGYNSASTFNGSLNIFKSADAPWPPARPVWNQYMYNVTNVNQDLTVPQYTFNNATRFTDNIDNTVRRPFNNFLQQATTIDLNGRPFYGVADVADVSASANATADGVGISVTFKNNGAQSLTAPYKVTLYKGIYGGEIVSTFTVTDNDVAIAATGRAETFMSLDDFCALNLSSIVVAVNDGGTGIAQLGGQQEECHTDNNTFTLNVADMCDVAVETTYVDHTACDSYLWHGTEYTESNTYYYPVDDSHVEALRLTIKHSSPVTPVNATACDSYTWVVGENSYIYTTSIEKDETLHNLDGCDSVVHLSLTVNHSTTAAQPMVVSYCGPYTWPFNGQTYSASTVVTDTKTGGSVAGCDSTMTLQLTISGAITITIPVTACKSYTWDNTNETYTETNIYTGRTQPSAANCDSTTLLDLTINQPSPETVLNETACDTYTWETETASTIYTESTNQSITLHNTKGCDSVVTLNLTIRHSTTANPFVASGCGRYTWDANGETYSESGTYPYTGRNVAGCDSNMTLDLTINDAIAVDINETACDAYAWESTGETYTECGEHSVSGQSIVGCDSTTTLHLTINQSSVPTNLRDHACESYERQFGNTVKTFTASTTFDTTLVNIGGCDSLVSLAITINHHTTADPIVLSWCNSYTWDANGETYSESGTYPYTGTNVAGCDSNMTLDLTINDAIAVNINETACDTYTWDATGETYAESGEHSVSGQSIVGCDSTTTLHLTIGHSSVPTNLRDHACETYERQFGNTVKTFTASTVFDTTLVNIDGCDSIVSLAITINHHTIADPIVLSLCNSYTWDANGETYNESGIHTHTGTNVAGCDSNMTLDLTISNAIEVNILVTACDTYTWDATGETYTESGEHSVSGQSVVGCDSTTTLHLTIGHSSVPTNLHDHACETYERQFGSTLKTFTASTVFDTTFVNLDGCDSLVSLAVTINHHTTADPVVLSWCNSYTWDANGETYSESGIHTYTGTNVAGCDSNMTLDLTISNAIEVNINETACDTYTWDATGETYTESGEHSVSGQSIVGCDSTTTLHLTIGHSSAPTNLRDHACETYERQFGSTVKSFTASTTFDTTFVNLDGCDSLVSLAVTINHHTTADPVVLSWCNSYTWDANGETYSESGIHTYTGTNVAGCDSNMTLDLTISNAIEVNIPVNACDTYTWNATGETYTESGNHSVSGRSTAGCDSTTWLRLTINHSRTASVSDTACDLYQWIDGEGDTVLCAADTTIIYTLQTVKQCDSTVTLSVVVNHANTETIEESACDSYTWLVNNQTYTTSGTHSETLTGANAYGCDSTIILQLTINHATNGMIDTAACDSLLWVVTGEVYRASGGYSTTISNAAGCDSNILLNLTIHTASPTTADTVLACQSYTWPLNGRQYTVSGIYNETTPNSVGCDSTILLVLSIAEPFVLQLSPDTTINMCGHAMVAAVGGNYYEVSPSASLSGMTSAGDTTFITLSPNTMTLYTVTAYSSTLPYGSSDQSLAQHLCPTVSSVTVNVTVDTTDLIVCDAYTWADNGLTYTQSGYYSCNTPTTDGCDSLRVLHIEVGNSVIDTVTQQACKRYYWSVNHTMYEVSGMYHETRSHDTGCDTTHYLRLTIDDCSEIAIPDNIDNPHCTTEPTATTFDMQPLFSCDGANGLSTPLVGDVDGDGKAEILACAADTAASTGKQVLVFDGQNGTLKYTLDVQRYSTSGQLMSIADINGDGTAEFFLVADNRYAYCYNATTGEQLWRSAERVDDRYLPMIADLNADNRPELVCGPYIFDASNGQLLLHGEQQSSGRGFGAPHTDVGEGRAYYMQALADIDRDGELEICAGNTIYKPVIANLGGEEGNTWQILRMADSIDDIVGYDGQTFLADFDHDGDMDICVIGFRETNKTDLYVWDGQTSNIIGYYNVTMGNAYGGNMTPSIPFCGDLDGDGNPEIMFNHPDAMRAFTYSPSEPTHIRQMHNSATYGETSGFTVFDFNRDGAVEIVYRGTQELAIIDGTTLSRISAPVTAYSGTITEYPVVADVNGDGHAEIIVAQTNESWNSNPQGKIVVYGAADDNWNSARSVWNQWAYNSVCINEDLTVPRHQYDVASVYPNGTEPFNGFLRQMPRLDNRGDIYVSIPDLDAAAGLASIDYDNGGATIHARYCNRGDAMMEAPYSICLYEDDYRGRVIGTYSVNDNLAVGSCTTQALRIPMIQLCHLSCNNIAIAVNDAGFGVAQQGGQPMECDTTNNVIKVRFTPIQPKRDTLRVAGCDRFRWDVTGETYTTSLTVNDTMPDVAGCDSINVLKLTIYKGSYDTIDTTACDMFVWRENNTHFLQSSVSTASYTTTHGCDSIKHIRVSIYHRFDTTEYVEACNSYRWPVDNRLYTYSTTHTEVMSTRNGCDSVHTLVVRVYYTSSDTTYDTICGGSYRVFGGVSYRESGHYTYAEPMMHACDSIHELFLTVKPKLDVKLKWTSQCEIQQYTIAARRIGDDSNTYLHWSAYPTDIELALQQDGDTIYVHPTLSTVYTATLSYTDDYACPVSATLSLKPTKPVEAAIDISTTRLTPDITTFRATAKGSGYEYHSWFIDHNYYSDMNSIEYEFDPLGGTDSVMVSLIVSSGNCTDRDSIVLHYSTANINVPNVFIPTDPNNSTFQVKGHGVLEYEIHIYNRQGLLVYHGNDINEAWDGKLKDGTQAQQGAYVYNIRYRLSIAPDELKRTTGTVTLIR